MPLFGSELRTVRLEVTGELGSEYLELFESSFHYGFPEKQIDDESETVTLTYSTWIIKDNFDCPIKAIKQWSEEWEQICFAWIYEDRSALGDHLDAFKYGIYKYQDGECINHFEETLGDILNRYKQEMRTLIINAFINMLFPEIVLNEDLKTEILTFTPYFGLNIDTICILEETWKDINTMQMNGELYKLKEKTNGNFAYALFQILTTKWEQIRDENEHILSIRCILSIFIDQIMLCLIEEITGFRMKRRSKCKYFGSAKGCRNGDDCHWSHNHPYFVEKCEYYNSFDGCMYGEECYYRHCEDEEPDDDCFFDVIFEDESNEMNKTKGIYVAVPDIYCCFVCKIIGDHWIMNCPRRQTMI